MKRAGRACRCAWLAFALGCGSHVTPIAELAAPDASDVIDASDPDEDAGPEPACMRSYTIRVPGLTSRYRMASERASWIDAARACEADGGHLIVIDNAAENAWLATIAEAVITNEESSHQLVWLGLGDSQVEGRFHWITGGGTDLPRWASDEPNSLNGDEDCAEIRPNGDWNDDRCNAEIAFVCECDGARSDDGYCDTAAAETCGDCETACASDQSCVKQLCE